ncbi:hypothetical protein SLS53_007454 [Cytospora paraplurivora]|uniref:NodB homology domain-containing protein n=1 Tax=Cytospora paraplurivora TaxID=2898453 RepID=A0AAN9U300_9PEZI
MKSYMITSLVVLPVLANALAPSSSQNIASVTPPHPKDDNRVPAEELRQPPLRDGHPMNNKALRDAPIISPRDKYPRPTVEWLAHLPRPELGSVPYGTIIEHCTEPNTMALSFDDGPWEYTSELLDLLADYGANATFFVCGSNMDTGGQLTGHDHPRLLRRMVDEGHQVGTHTWGHMDLMTLDRSGVNDQMLRNEQALVETLGMIPTYFRPPYFSADGSALDAVGRLGYHVINADVDTRDWVGDYDAARANFDEGVRQAELEGGEAGGLIVLAHNIRERTVEELVAYMIENAREKGYSLVTVGECLGDPERNWYRNHSTGGSWMSGGRGRGREMMERAVVPPPDAPKEESRKAAMKPVLSHKLHAHTLPPNDVMKQYQQTLAPRAEGEASKGPTSSPTTTTSVTVSYYSQILGIRCKRDEDPDCETVYKIVTGTPKTKAAAASSPTSSPTTTTPTTASHYTSIIATLCERPGDCTTVYKTVAGPPPKATQTIVPTPGPTGPPTTHHNHLKRLIFATRPRKMTTLTIQDPFEGGQLPPKGFRLKPTKIARRPVGQARALEEREEEEQGEEQGRNEQHEHQQQQEQEQVQERVQVQLPGLGHDRIPRHSKAVNVTATGKPATGGGARSSGARWGLVALVVASYLLFW